MVRRRIRVLALLVAAPFLAVLVQLWRVQGNPEAHRSYLESEHEQTTLDILIPPRRGRFLDRRGRSLAENRASFDIVVRHVPALLYARRRLLDDVLEELRRAAPPASGSRSALEGQTGETLEQWMLGRFPVGRSLDPPPDGGDEPVPLLVGIPGSARPAIEDRIADYRASESGSGPPAFALREARGAAPDRWALMVRPRLALHPERLVRRLERRLGREVPRGEIEARLEEHRRTIETRMADLEDRLRGTGDAGDGEEAAGGTEGATAGAKLSDRAIRRRLRGEISAFRSWTWPLHEDVPLDLVTWLEYHREEFPELEVRDVSRRVYPLGEVTGSLLGYLRPYRRLDKDLRKRLEREQGLHEFDGGRIRSEDSFAFERQGAVRASDPVGVDGLEGRFDARLRGTYGLRIVHCNARYEAGAELSRVFEEPGGDLHTTIDAELQARLYEAVAARCRNASGGTCRAGSAVVLDLRPGSLGALRAVVSYPSYDPDLVASGDVAYRERMDRRWSDPKVWPEAWQRVSWTRQRAVYHALCPGSVFKVLVTLAAFESGHDWEGPLTYRRKYPCTTGTYEFSPEQGAPLTCHFSSGGGHHGHSHLDLVDALRFSCNNYFYYMVHTHLDVGELHDWAFELGFGRHPGYYRNPWVVVDGQRVALTGRRAGWAAGLLVDPRPPASDEEAELRDPRDLRKRSELRGPAVCRYGIGQVYVEATPLQVARFMGAVALRGRLVPTPWIVEPLDPEVSGLALRAREETWDAVGRGLWGAVHSEGGTAAGTEPSLRRYAIAAKTGTAQFRNWPDGETVRYHAWLAGFGPLPDPTFAFAISLEATPEFGGPACAPVAQVMLDWLAESGEFPGLRGEGDLPREFPGWEARAP